MTYVTLTIFVLIRFMSQLGSSLDSTSTSSPSGKYSDEVPDSESRNLNVLLNTSWISVPYPSPPSCDRLLALNVDPIAVSVHIWKVDVESEHYTGFIYWKETLVAECYRDFWATDVPRVLQTSRTAYDAPLSHLNQTYLERCE